MQVLHREGGCARWTARARLRAEHGASFAGKVELAEEQWITRRGGGRSAADGRTGGEEAGGQEGDAA